MRGRPILLVLGTLALVAGAALVVLQLQTPAPPAEVVAKADSQAVLVMVRPVKARTLLRPDDLGWKAIAIAAVPTGAYVRGTATEGDFAGAVVRNDLQLGDILTANQVVKAGEPGFLPAVLSEGMRATSIAVGLAEGASGLIVPGDRVDVVLIQNFTEAGVELSHRSVGETVLSNLRVIAIDQKTATDGKPRAGEPGMSAAAVAAAAATAAAVEPRIAKTVTLEVTVRQAEVLMVAQQLGKIQLTLRDAGDEKASTKPALAAAPPTWGADVSPALDGLRDHLTPTTGNSPAPLPTPPPSSEVNVYHGPATEVRCFDDMGRTATDCTTPTAVPPGAVPAGPVPTIPVPTPGKPAPGAAVPPTPGAAVPAAAGPRY
ncbi:MAG: pilus assembly protein CpaB [Rhodospirillaceae bacterium]|jgi:pilus assembly protein CpaB|nr:pilus assembly protein CpaB [Rhodospirillaceae bacterium]MEA2849682.1 pilus assembly protein CpaB [Rhodospirillaceae bacterium]